MNKPSLPIGLLTAGGLTALFGSACCLAPLALVSIGLGGAWLSQLQVFEPLRPYLLGAASLFLLLAYRRIWRPLTQCQPGLACAKPAAHRLAKAFFLFASALLLVALASPYLAPLFY